MILERLDNSSSSGTHPQLLRDDATGVVVREATLLDVTAMATLAAGVESNSLLAPLGTGGDASQLDVVFIRAALWKPDELWLVAVLEANLVGFAQLVRAESIELRRVCVAFDSVAFVIGTVLLSGCIRAARESGYRQLWACVPRERARSLEFFRDCDFQLIGSELVWVNKTHPTEFSIISRAVDEEGLP